MATQTLDRDGLRLSKEQSIDAGATGDPILIANPAIHGRVIEQVVVTVKCTTANTVEYTLSSRAEVDAETADWIAWEPGSVTSNKGAVLPASVTAVRCDNTGASASTFKVIA